VSLAFGLDRGVATDNPIPIDKNKAEVIFRKFILITLSILHV
jgi:hypothetical protein